MNTINKKEKIHLRYRYSVDLYEILGSKEGV